MNGDIDENQTHSGILEQSYEESSDSASSDKKTTQTRARRGLGDEIDTGENKTAPKINIKLGKLK